MKQVSKWMGWIVVCAIFCTLGFVVADEDADMDAQMAAMMKNATPGEHHKELASLVGDWKAVSKIWMAPGTPPSESTGTVKNTMILGGRFLQSELNSEMMGMPFQGFGIDGYDILKQKHTGFWMDTMGTMTMEFEGGCDKSHKVRTLYSEFLDPASGQPTKIKAVMTLKTADEHTFEMFHETPEGLVKTVEVVYTRM